MKKQRHSSSYTCICSRIIQDLSLHELDEVLVLLVDAVVGQVHHVIAE